MVSGGAYVLMFWLGIGGGFTQTFATRATCEYAGKTYAEKLERHHQHWWACVPQ
jgi:hypothetical protein